MASFPAAHHQLNQLHGAAESSSSGTLAADLGTHDGECLVLMSRSQGLLRHHVGIGGLGQPRGRSIAAGRRRRIRFAAGHDGRRRILQMLVATPWSLDWQPACRPAKSLPATREDHSAVREVPTVWRWRSAGTRLPRAEQAATENRCKSSQARLQGSAIASSQASSKSLHRFASANRFTFWRSSVGGASSSVLSLNRDTVRNSPQRRPRKMR